MTILKTEKTVSEGAPKSRRLELSRETLEQLVTSVEAHTPDTRKDCPDGPEGCSD